MIKGKGIQARMVGEDLQDLVLEFRKISCDIESFYQEKDKFLQTLKVSSVYLTALK